MEMYESQIIFKLSGKDKKALQEAAHLNRLSLSAWVRNACVAAANEQGVKI